MSLKLLCFVLIGVMLVGCQQKDKSSAKAAPQQQAPGGETEKNKTDDPNKENSDKPTPFDQYVVPEGFADWNSLMSADVGQLDIPSSSGIDPNESLFSPDPVTCTLYLYGIARKAEEEYWVVKAGVEAADGATPPITLISLEEFDGEKLVLKSEEVELVIFLSQTDIQKVTKFNIRWQHGNHYHVRQCAEME